MTATAASAAMPNSPDAAASTYLIPEI
jgi:hypothetical protein